MDLCLEDITRLLWLNHLNDDLFAAGIISDEERRLLAEAFVKIQED